MAFTVLIAPDQMEPVIKREHINDSFAPAVPTVVLSTALAPLLATPRTRGFKEYKISVAPALDGQRPLRVNVR